jgi:hypothetical protein
MRQRAFRNDIGKSRNWPARFWAKVAKGAPDQCWPWQGTRHCKGYGLITFRQKTQKAHRIVVMLTTGAMPPSEQPVIHSCDNPPCCNPSHVHAATYRENAVDMFQKGRAHRPRGAQHSQSKLTDAQVLAIRADMRPQRAIAKEYGVSQPLIGMVKRGEIWRHVT